MEKWESVDLGLTHPVNTVEALPLAGGVPGGVQQEEMVGGGQVEPNTSGLEAEEQHSRPVLPVALEHLDHVGPLGVTHAAVQPSVAEIVKPQQRLDDGEETGELRDHNHTVLGVVPPDPQHVLQDGIHLQFRSSGHVSKAYSRCYLAAGHFHDDVIHVDCLAGRDLALLVLLRSSLQQLANINRLPRKVLQLL